MILKTSILYQSYQDISLYFTFLVRYDAKGQNLGMGSSLMVQTYKTFSGKQYLSRQDSESFILISKIEGFRFITLIYILSSICPYFISLLYFAKLCQDDSCIADSWQMQPVHITEHQVCKNKGYENPIWHNTHWKI